MDSWLLIVFGLVAITSALPLDEGFVKLDEDNMGNYKLLYSTETATREEQRYKDGHVIGRYSYVDPEGVKHEVNYVAAADHGFGAESKDIPQEVEETPENKMARHEHLKVLHAAEEMDPRPEEPVPVPHVLPMLSELPKFSELPYGFTPPLDDDHLHARAMLLKAYAEALGRLAEEYKRHV